MSGVLLVQVALASFAFLFSEFVQYSQSRVSNIGELERRWAFADTSCRHEFGYHARLQSTLARVRIACPLAAAASLCMCTPLVGGREGVARAEGFKVLSL